MKKVGYIISSMIFLVVLALQINAMENTDTELEISSKSQRYYRVSIAEESAKFLEIDKTHYLPGTTVTVITHASIEREVGAVFCEDERTIGTPWLQYFNATNMGDGTFTFVMPDYPIVLGAGFHKPGPDTVIDVFEKYFVSRNVDSNQVDFSMKGADTTAGKTVAFTAKPKLGYAISEITILNMKDNTPIEFEYDRITERYLFTMPTANVMITIQTSIVIDKTFEINTEFNGKLGYVELSQYTAKNGDKVYVDIYPNDDVDISGIYVKGDQAGSRLPMFEDNYGYYFIMTGHDVTVCVEFEKIEPDYPKFDWDFPDDEETIPEPEYEPEPEPMPQPEPNHDEICPSKGYKDVSSDSWYHEAVDYVLANSLMTGYYSDVFAPTDTTTRAMIVTVLWRLEGSPVVSDNTNFNDVLDGAWYAKAVKWASSTGVVKGVSDTLFDPNGTITREQLITMLYRYAQYKGRAVPPKAIVITYADALKISPWAIHAVVWSNNNSIINGGDGLLEPQGAAMRAEIAQMLFNYEKLK